MLDAFVEQGGNFIDTADKYSGTQSEQIIGKWLVGQSRDDLVVATKCFFKTSGNINSRGLSRKHIISACEASLKRLRTDYIDLYQVHAPDPHTPMEETMFALDALVNQGKVHYIGCCNYPAWKLVKCLSISQDNSLSSFISGQYLYNLLKRDIESEVLPACHDSGMGVICWSPLSGGMLTGKYEDPNRPPKGTRLGMRTELTKNKYREWYDKSIAVVRKLVEIAARHSVAPSTIALAWLLRNERIASVIVGAKNTDQIIENCKAGDFVLPVQEWEPLSELSRANYGYPTEWINGVAGDWFERLT